MMIRPGGKRKRGKSSALLDLHLFEGDGIIIVSVGIQILYDIA